MDKWLERTTNVAVVTLALVALAMLFQPVKRERSQADAPGYLVGDRLDASKLGLPSGGLVIITKSTCKFCTSSMPFYRSLKEVTTTWVAVGEDDHTNRLYLESNQITPAAVVTAQSAGLGQVRATPTLLLVSGDGSILNVWVGRLSRDGENQVRAALRNGSLTSSAKDDRHVMNGG